MLTKLIVCKSLEYLQLLRNNFINNVNDLITLNISWLENLFQLANVNELSYIRVESCQT